MINKLFQRFRPVEEAKAALGSTVKQGGVKWHCVGHNDLVCLYWAKSTKPKARQYYDSRLDALAGYPVREGS